MLTSKRLYIALGGFGVMGVIAGTTLTGRTRLVTLVLVGAMALKAVLAYWHERVR